MAKFYLTVYKQYIILSPFTVGKLNILVFKTEVIFTNWLFNQTSGCKMVTYEYNWQKLCWCCDPFFFLFYYNSLDKQFWWSEEKFNYHIIGGWAALWVGNCLTDRTETLIDWAASNLLLALIWQTVQRFPPTICRSKTHLCLLERLKTLHPVPNMKTVM